MKRALEIATAAGIRDFPEAGSAGALDHLLPGGGRWEVEIGFGKGRFLLARAATHPERRFLGVEVAGEYFRLVARRLARRATPNVVLVRGEALAFLATTLPAGFADAVHVYFPDPWPKSRHQRRRLLTAGSVDLLLRILAPGGRLCFATDFLDYGEEVRRLFVAYPGATVRTLEGGWPEGARTNYEAKYEAEGRPIVRLEVTCRVASGPHPAGQRDLEVAFGPTPSSVGDDSA